MVFTYEFKIDYNDGNGLKDFKDQGLLYPYVGFSTLSPLNEELDSGSMIILSNRENVIPMYSFIQILVKKSSDNSIVKTIEMYVAFDDKSRITAKNNGSKIVYEHPIEIVELTKKFEKCILETITFTQSQNPNIIFYTLKNAMERIMRIAPIGEDDISVVWDYDSDYSNLPMPDNRFADTISTDLQKYYDVEIPELYLQEPTLREALDEILKYINGVVRLKTKVVNGNVKKTVISADLYNILKNKIHLLTEGLATSMKAESESDEINIEEYSTQNESFTNNSISTSTANGNTITYPTYEKPFGVYEYETGDTSGWFNNVDYDTMRSRESEYQITDNNFGVLTEYPIQQISKLLIPCVIDVRYKNINDVIGVTGRKKLNTFMVDLDISNRTLEYEAYQKLGVTYVQQQKIEVDSGVDYAKRNTVYYNKENNFITLSGSYKIIFEFSHFLATIAFSAIEWVVKNVYDNYLKSKQDEGTAYIEIGLNIKAKTFSGSEEVLQESDTVIYIYDDKHYEIRSLNLGVFNAPQKILYKIEYQPIYDSHITTQRESTKEINLKSSSLINQQQRLISLENFSNSMWSISQRKGTHSNDIAVRHISADTLFKVGDYTEDGRVITNAEYIYFNDFIIGKYSFSQDYNRINEFIGVNSEIRQWQIPSGSKAKTRQIKINHFIEVGNILYSPNNQNDWTSGTSLNFIGSFIGILCSYTYKSGGYEDYRRPFGAVFSTNDTSVTNAWENLSGLLLQCVCFGGGNTINFNFGFNDNVNAVPYTFVDNSKLLKQPITYCKPLGDYAGFLRNFRFSLINKNEYQISGGTTNNSSLFKGDLPLCEEPVNVTSGSTTFKKGECALIHSKDLLVLKDPAEILKFSYEIGVVSTSKYVTIGKWLTIDNWLVQDNVNTDTKTIGFLTNDYSKYDNSFITTSDYVTNNTYKTLDGENKIIDTIASYGGNFITIHFNTAFVDWFKSSSYNAFAILGSNSTTTSKKVYMIINKKYFNETFDKNIPQLNFSFVKERSNVKNDY